MIKQHLVQTKACLYTSEIAQAAGVHPNTVRLYEEWGFLPAIPRLANGYRCFNQTHIDQMRLATLIMRCTWLGGHVRHTAQAVVRTAATGDLKQALILANELKVIIAAKQTQAHIALAVLTHWVQNRNSPPSQSEQPLHISSAAHRLDVTADKLRHWERDGLITVSRDPENGYRLYRTAEINRLHIIRTLRQARYSTMSILRMLLALDNNQTNDLPHILDTPRADEDAIYATDKWLSTLTDLQDIVQQMIELLQKMSV